MVNNGKMSCSSKSRHINITFFWITDRVKQGHIEVKHCPTDIMLADFLTKPLQDKWFQLFCNVMMGWEHIGVLWKYYNEQQQNNNVSSKGITHVWKQTLKG